MIRITLLDREVRQLDTILRTSDDPLLRHHVQNVLMAHRGRRHPVIADNTNRTVNEILSYGAPAGADTGESTGEEPDSVNGKTKDGRHRLNDGALFTVTGFTPLGDVVVNHGWVIDRAFGHVAHGHMVTSHASQGKTIHKVSVGESAASFGAANRRRFYLSVTRGREQAVHDDRGGGR